MPYLKKLMLLLTLAFAATGSTQEMPEGRLMRFPDIYKDKIVFMYGGDLWLASSAGGDARRITSDAGRELFPKLSDFEIFLGLSEVIGHLDILQARGRIVEAHRDGHLAYGVSPMADGR